MSHCEFEDIILHLNDRISSIRQVLEDGTNVLSIDGLLDQVNMPSGRGPVRQSGPVDVQPTQQEHLRKTSKTQIREMEFINYPEFKTIPHVNTAVTGK
uniref:Uncharacterized protein n=1 Tax=Oncorhynchus mykiss TaxID=8022 RepID=A0A8C7UVV2_ONCMY